VDQRGGCFHDALHSVGEDVEVVNRFMGQMVGSPMCA